MKKDTWRFRRASGAARSRSRGAILATFVAAGALVLGGCSSPGSGSGGEPSGNPPSKPTGTMTMAFSQAPASLDFMASTQGNVHEKTVNVVESLFAPDDKWTPHPMLAESVDANADSTDYTITLRSDVKFHNGQPLTSADVVASIERWRVLDSRTDVWFKDLTSLTAPTANTVEFKFSTPAPQLELFLSDKSAGIIPADLAKAAGSNVLSPESLVGTGPYQFVSWEPGVELKLKAYPDYKPVAGEPNGWSGEKHAYIENLVFKDVADPDARLAGMTTGEFQFADALPYDKLAEVKGNANIKLAPRPIGASVAYFSAKSQIVKDPRVRHAIMLALNIDEIGQSYGPDELWDLSPALATQNARFVSNAGAEEWNSHNLDAAKKLLGESDYNGETMTIIASANTPESVAAAIVLKEQLGRIDIPVKVENMESASMQEKRGSGLGWELAIGTMNAGPDMTQQSVLTCDNTVGGYCSDEMNALFDQFLAAPTEKEQQAIHDKIQELTYKDLPYLKLPETSRLDVVSTDVQNFNPTRLPQPKMWNIWLTQ